MQIFLLKYLYLIKFIYEIQQVKLKLLVKTQCVMYFYPVNKNFYKLNKLKL